jgi:hypothetical protein
MGWPVRPTRITTRNITHAARSKIEHTVFYECHFPVAYLIAEYGHYRLAQHYSNALVLRWSHVYAHVDNDGWLNAMQPVNTVTWWRPFETGTSG